MAARYRGPPNLPPPNFPQNLPPPPQHFLDREQEMLLKTSLGVAPLPPVPLEPPRRFTPNQQPSFGNLNAQPRRKIPAPPILAPQHLPPPILAQAPVQALAPVNNKQSIVKDLYQSTINNNFLSYDVYLPYYDARHTLKYENDVFEERIPARSNLNRSVLRNVFGKRAMLNINGDTLRVYKPTSEEVLKVIDTLVNLPNFDLSGITRGVPPQQRPASPPARPVSPPQQRQSPPPQQAPIQEDINDYIIDNLHRTAMTNKFLQYIKDKPRYNGIHKITYENNELIENVPNLMSVGKGYLRLVLAKRAVYDNDDNSMRVYNPTSDEVFKIISFLVIQPDFDLSDITFEPSQQKPVSPQQRAAPVRPASPPQQQIPASPPQQRLVSPPRQQRPVSPPPQQRPVSTPPQQRPVSPQQPQSKNAFTISDFANDPIDDNYYGVGQLQQRSEEDRFQVKTFGSFRYYAVFDGHGASHYKESNHVVDYVKQHLHERLASALYKFNLQNPQVVADTIKDEFVKFDIEMKSKNLEFGSTATIVLIDDDEGIIYQVNLGDSRSFVFDREANILSVTKDHAPENPIETARIEKAGGGVYFKRVDGELAVARAFGDFDFKGNNNVPYDPINGKVSAVPDVIILAKPVEPFYIMLTSDAPYDKGAYTTQSLIDMFSTFNAELAPNNNDPSSRINIIAGQMVQQIKHKTNDDITVMLVFNSTKWF